MTTFLRVAGIANNKKATILQITEPQAITRAEDQPIQMKVTLASKSE